MIFKKAKCYSIKHALQVDFKLDIALNSFICRYQYRIQIVTHRCCQLLLPFGKMFLAYLLAPYYFEFDNAKQQNLHLNDAWNDLKKNAHIMYEASIDGALSCHFGIAGPNEF
jgi:hypothetical protein